MKHWQVYIALLLFAVFLIPVYEGYVQSDIDSMKSDIKATIRQINQNVADTNSIIRTRIITMNPVTSYSGPIDFTHFFQKKDIKSISRYMNDLNTTAQDTANALNFILKKSGAAIKENTPATIGIPTYYISSATIIPNTMGYRDYIETDLVTLKDDIRQLKQISQENTNVIIMIRNQKFVQLPPYGPLPDNTPNYAQNSFRIWAI
jgi:hypothetical protein